MKTFVVAVSIVLLDQLSKQFALSMSSPIWLLAEKVGLRLAFNDAVAFSLPIKGIAAIAVSLLILIGLMIFHVTCAQKRYFSVLPVAFGLVYGGAVSNLIDRFLHGAVIDYIQVYWWPTFNLADSAITIGFLLFLLRSTRLRK